MKKFHKLGLWVVISISCQCLGLFILEQTIFKHNSDFETQSLDLQKTNTEDINAVIPNDANSVNISYNGRYLTYLDDKKLYVQETKDGKTNQIVTEDKGEILYYKWLSDRERLVIAERVNNEDGDMVQLITYNPKDYSQIVVRSVCPYKEGMTVKKISASVLTGVYYIDVDMGGMKSVLYRIDRNEDLTKVAIKASVLGNIEVIPREDRLIYEDQISNEFYITNPNGKLTFNSNKKLALLGINKEGVVFVGEVNSDKVSTIYYGSVKTDTSKWDKVVVSNSVNKDDLYFNEKNEILANDNLEGKVKNLMTNKEIEYDGKLIQIKEDFIATVSNDGKLNYISLEDDK